MRNSECVIIKFGIICLANICWIVQKHKLRLPFKVKTKHQKNTGKICAEITYIQDCQLDFFLYFIDV